MDDEPIKWVTALLNSYRFSQGTDNTLLVGSYLFAVENEPSKAIVKTAQRFIRGEVDGHDARFPPTTAVFAQQVRRQVVIDNYEALPKLKAPPKDHAPVEPKIGPEKFKSLSDVLAGRISWLDFAMRWGASTIKPQED